MILVEGEPPELLERMYACVCVYVYICMYVCMYVCGKTGMINDFGGR